MGKIFSKPKMPSLPAEVYYAPPATVTPPSAADDVPAGSGGGNTDTAPEITTDEQRLQNILTRRRGRLGTISTSFNGALIDQTAALPPRKTLLGD